MKFKKNTPCYVCGEPVEKPSKEHVPPQGLFPKDCRRGLIQVPSCKNHNEDKSQEDLYLQQVSAAIKEDSARSKKAEEALDDLRRRVKTHMLQNHSILEEGPGWMRIEIDEETLSTLFSWIARGLYWEDRKRHFSGQEIARPLIEYIDYHCPKRNKLKKLVVDISKKTWPKTPNGRYPHIFRYGVEHNSHTTTVVMELFETTRVIVAMYHNKEAAYLEASQNPQTIKTLQHIGIVP
jgi:hypothetical protein